MKVFVSSLIADFGQYRGAAASAIHALGQEAIRAEDFPAAPESPQQACLAGVRDADATVLILGEAYGRAQASGFSATHEEYREARDRGPVLVFIQDGVEHDAAQATFITEVQSWEHGHYTAGFTSPDDLRDAVIKGLHGYIVANETAPLDEAEITARAMAAAPSGRSFGSAELFVAVAGGPARSVLRPAEIEDPALTEFLIAQALTGPHAVLTTRVGTSTSIVGDTVTLAQERVPGRVSLNEAGDLLAVQPAIDEPDGRSGFNVLVEEVISERVARAIRFAAGILDHIDSAQRLSHVCVVAGFVGASYLTWTTREQLAKSTNEGVISIGGGSGSSDVVVSLSPPLRRRAALLHDTRRLAEDFTVRLRREVTQAR